jgi:LEA14-like dessication related protein
MACEYGMGVYLRQTRAFAAMINVNLLVKSIFITISLLLASCAGLQPKLEQPTVKVAGLQLLPTQGLSQPIEVSLLIANPNDRDLSLRGIAYTVGIENFDVLSGVSNELPVLTAYQETPVKVIVTANVLQLVRLFEHFGRNGINENVNYNFSAKLDFSAWLPSMRINEKGSIPLMAKKH